MAFPKKTWKDRVSEQPQRRLITPVGGGTATTVDVTRQEGIVIQEGDAFSAANMNDLENRIKTALDTDEASIQTINTKSTTNANNIASLQNNVNTLMSIKAPNYHASPSTTFGIGKKTEYGHLKITDGAYEGNAAAGMAASSNLVGVVNDKVDAIQNELTANGNRIYMDYQGGKYGYNTSANRGADTFHPFKSDITFDVFEQAGDQTASGLLITIQNALQYTKIIIIGSEGSEWYAKTGGLVLSVNGGTVDDRRPSSGPYNKNCESEIITPTSNEVSVHLATYVPEEGVSYPHLTAYCIKN